MRKRGEERGVLGGSCSLSGENLDKRGPDKHAVYIFTLCL